MTRKRKLIHKIGKKKTDKKCYFCFCDEYALLDVHRIVEGCYGGEYSEHNTITVCASCHRRIHAGTIKIDRKFFTSNGKYILHFWQDNVEKWEYEPD